MLAALALARRGLRAIGLIAGAEGTGIKQALLDCCDLTVHIAMRGMNSSMNVATACAIAATILCC